MGVGGHWMDHQVSFKWNEGHVEALQIKEEENEFRCKKHTHTHTHTHTHHCNRADSVGPSLVQVHLCFLFVENRLQSAFLTFLEFQGTRELCYLGTVQIQTAAKQWKEEIQGKKKRKSSQDTEVLLWDRVLVPLKGIYITIALSFSGSTESTRVPNAVLGCNLKN